MKKGEQNFSKSLSNWYQARSHSKERKKVKKISSWIEISFDHSLLEHSILEQRNNFYAVSSIRRGMWAEWRSCSKRNFPRILVNDRSRLTYHCSRAIITPGRNQKPSFSFDQRGGTRRSLLLESFQPFETRNTRSIGSLLDFREMESWWWDGIYEEELWKSASIPSVWQMISIEGKRVLIFFFFLTFQVIQVFNKIVCYGEFEDTFIRFK